MVSFLEFANLPVMKIRKPTRSGLRILLAKERSPQACASSFDRACPWLHFLCTWPVTTLNLPLFLSSGRDVTGYHKLVQCLICCTSFQMCKILYFIMFSYKSMHDGRFRGRTVQSV